MHNAAGRADFAASRIDREITNPERRLFRQIDRHE
jgi:hypothetical protein